MTDLTTPAVNESLKKLEHSVSLSTANNRTTPHSLEPLTKSKADLDKIQKSLHSLIDTMAQNPSILSRMSKFWGNIPLWQKIIAGIVLTVPTLAIGILLNIAVVWVISICTLVAYITTSVVLDDHNSHSKTTTQNLQEGVTGLTQTLGIVIDSLDAIREKLAQRIDEFEKENAKLASGVQKLARNNEALALEISQLKRVEEKLKQTEKELTEACTELKSTVKAQTKLAQKTQQALDDQKEEYEHNQFNLAEKVKELEGIKSKLYLDVDRYEKVVQALQGNAKSLMAQLTHVNSEQRLAYESKLTEFVNNKEASFLSIVDYISKEGQKLAELQKQYKIEIEKLETNLELAGQQIERLTRLPSVEDQKEDTLDEVPSSNKSSLKASPKLKLSPLSFLNNNAAKKTEHDPNSITTASLS